ncbi:MAG: DUF547 domain-containing protein [Pseudomonadota bacterium]
MTLLTRRQLIAGAAAAALTTTHAASARAARPIDQFRPSGNGRVDHQALDMLLKKHVKRDSAGYTTFDYAALKSRDHAALKAYIVAIEAVAPSSLSVNEAHAYWINLYNAATVDIVADYYPVTSIKKINLGGGGLFGSGPWSRKMITVEGTPLSLDDVEHRIVRALFNDPMSHYGLNCASYSCPNLVETAYTAGNVDSLLVLNAVDYINHSRGVTVQSGRITSSKIYSWYAADFGGRGNLKQHWGQFAEADHNAAIKAASLGRFVYDWSLNDAS